MTQNKLNSAVSSCLEELADAMKIASKSRDILMELLVFEGNRIDSLHDKMDILMTERAENKIDKTHYKQPLTEEESFFANEEIHFEDYNFEVATADSLERTWSDAESMVRLGFRLPTIDELRLMYLCKERLGMNDEYYWSSSELKAYDYAWNINFSSGDTDYINKINLLSVRLVRTLEN